MPTINEIAKKSGVSRSTVSRVLNHHPYVSETKRLAVLQAIQEINYIPNSIARQLRSKSTRTVAILVPHAHHPFFSQLIRSISQTLMEKGYKASIIQTFYQKDIELDTFQLLKSKEIDGIILTSLENQWVQIEPFLNFGPIILCNEYEEKAPIPIFCYDEYDVAFKATSYLINQGYQKIGFCFDVSHSKAQKLRRKGYTDALRKAQLPIRKEWIFQGAISIEDGFRIFQQLVSLENRPTAIFTGNDQVAAGMIKAATNNGYAIPSDLAIIGFDNQRICEVTTPTITTIDIPIMQVGFETATSMVECLVNNQKVKRMVKKFKGDLCIRESC
ncbi:LacI family DNA-binding transcriptional regulator [Risungbinella massiliensis]|uniref:LacI family DNA-binding transcriptional regulator n=1 Tax=Risungbinella massiliensis TaxID=1329796 RepID=UPI0005CBF999|nr:LacI family DNA-binding transcriptional regulator [Risungbinella massiliensis]